MALLTQQQLTEIRNQYINDSSFCVSLNSNVSQTLPVLRKQMLADMMPNTGQYASDTVTNTSMYGKYNIFAGTGKTGWSQPLYKYPQLVLVPSTPDYYYNSQGNIDSTMLGSTLQNISGTDYTAQYKENWAKSMLVYHPEYSKLKFAEDSLRSSFDYMDSVQQVVSPFNVIVSDPYFAIPSRISDKDTLTKYSNVSWTQVSGYSFWQLSYADAVGCKTIFDTLSRNNCYNNMPKVQTAVGTTLNNGIGIVTLTTAMQSQAWQMYKVLYAQVRGDMVNHYINVRPGTTDTLDNASLIAQGYILHFPYSYAQSAQNFGLTWYPTGGGSGSAYNVSDSAKKYGSHCDGYIIAWRQALLDCPALAAKDSASKEQILNSITGKMVQVCQKGTDGANLYGSSTVSPANAGATFTSFEQVVNWVLDSAGIAKNTLYCNPYGIEWPKPYNKNQPMSAQLVSVLDTCTCTQWNWLKQQITAAGYSTGSLTTINQYLLTTYQDTITAVLYNGLQQCGGGLYLMNCKSKDTTVNNPKSGLPYTYTITHCDTLYGVPLATPQPLPAFLNCGFTGNSCYSCAQFTAFENDFYTLFGKHPVFTGTITSADTIAWNQLFARYVNFKTGLQKSWLYYADKFNSSSCGVGGITGSGNGLSICVERKPLNDTTGLTQTISPCQWVRIRALEKAGLIYQYQQQQLVAGFIAAYNSKCQTATETFTATDSVKEYHYTLYYYDQAGNLVKTVPPKGVRPDYSTTFLNSVKAQRTNMQAGLTWTAITPQHSLVTRYNFNSLNQVVLQKTPDAGVNKFYYDRLGRLVVSQNAKQAQALLQYSYTLYDPLGRITEVGQLTGGSALTDAVAKDTTQLKNWFSTAANSRNQITQTVYDIAYGASPSSPDGLLTGYLTQRNLRNRASYSQVINNATDTYPVSATYYSYDIRGNVDTLLQDFGNSSGVSNAMNQSGNRFKKVVYNYDLISGKVNQVSYQPGSWDAYYHRYAYDAENRLTDVYTGRDSVMLQLFPEREAHYTYYRHSALARMELGQLKVQKQDYVYTLQGWLKSVNPDNTITGVTAKNVYNYELNYFNNDYKPINGTSPYSGIAGQLGTEYKQLYNGNISSMGINIPKLGNSLLYNFQYDQLNRLIVMDAWNSTNDSWASLVKTIDYKEQLSYDGNGNILTYLRNGTGSSLNLNNYSYTYTAGSNRLASITNSISAATGTYSYDAIGNVIKDDKQNVATANWNVYGKLQTVTKTGGLQISYTYNSGGVRVLKQVADTTEAYVRDAAGNVMAVYKKAGNTASIKLSEINLYGSSQLGAINNITLTAQTVTMGGGFADGKQNVFARGEKEYLLTDHRVNTMVSITDRRQQITADNQTINYYVADIRSATYYSSYGAISNAFNADTIKYAHNGQRRSPEISGTAQSALFWEYNGDVGRRWNIDPKPNVSFSPYSVFEDNPIWHNDILGDSTGPGPTPIKTGTSTFYIQRAWDFVKRNPKGKIPSYYMGYGDKYMNKFKNITKKTLSPQGQKWLDKTLVNLQEAIENKLTKTKEGATIENDDEKFTDFAFDTHVDAYEKAGVLLLPVMDKVKIGLTPDAKDLFSDRGLKQAGQIAVDQASLYIALPAFAIMQAKEAYDHAGEIKTMVHDYYIANKPFFDEMAKANPQGWKDPEHVIIRTILTPFTFRF